MLPITVLVKSSSSFVFFIAVFDNEILFPDWTCFTNLDNIIIKKRICLLLCVLVFNGCTAPLKMTASEEGYAVSKRGIIIPEFTKDCEGGYPGDKNLAKERYRRRKKYVDKWYKENNHYYAINEFVETMKILIVIPSLPFLLVADVYNLMRGHELTEEERERIVERNKERNRERSRSHAEAGKRLKEYIQKDCLEEESKK